MTLSTSETRLIASRYVTALFPLAEEKKELDKVLADLETLAAAVAGHPELARALSNPITTREEKSAVVAELAKKIKASALVSNLLAQMAQNNRLACLSMVAATFRERLMAARGEIAIDIIASTELTQTQIDDITKAVAKEANAKVQANVTINSDILGGIMIRHGSTLLDYSLRGKLQRLGDNLKARVATQ